MSHEHHSNQKIQNEQFAKDRARWLSKENKGMFTVIRCEKTDGWYIDEGDGGMIRNFETIVAHYKNGKKIKL